MQDPGNPIANAIAEIERLRGQWPEAQLEALLAPLRAQLAATPATPPDPDPAPDGDRGAGIATQGGAVVPGAVLVHGGHFIGRDSIKTIINCFQGEDPAEAQSVIAHYLHALSTDLAGLRLGEVDAPIDHARRDPLQLADVYVPLDTRLQVPKDQTLAQWLAPDRDPRRGEPGEPRETRPVPAVEALAAHRRLTLLGPPGSGKSTFGASVLLALAQAWQGHGDQLAGLGGTWTYGPLLPIRVVLRRFAAQLSPGDQPARAGDLWRFIGQDLDDRGYGPSTAANRFVQRIARTTGALFLLDGLDECGSRARQGRVLAAVDELVAGAGPRCRFLLTARPYAWPDGPAPAAGVYELADLDGDQIEQFIRAWYIALVRRRWCAPGDADRKVADLLAARQRPDLRPLAANPLLLTLMATLHSNRGRLPDDRADLYNDSVELLLLRWNTPVGADQALLAALAVPGLKLKDLREVLEALAFEVHAASLGRAGTADIGEGRLVRAFRHLLQGSRDKAALAVEYIEQRAGLLLGQGEKDGERWFCLPHRTFQEFLAACHLANQVDLNDTANRLARQDAGHWQEVLVLAARQAGSERGAALADALIGSEPCDPGTADTATDADFRCAAIAAAQLLEIGLANLAGSRSRDAVRRRVVTWLLAGLAAVRQVPGPAQRARMGDLLSALGDPRFDARRFCLPGDDWLGFVQIPADPGFRIGTRGSSAKRFAEIIGEEVPDWEINDALTQTPEFYIARYPVTVGQFKAFVAATGYAPGEPAALRDPDSRPVSWVSWHEALAYCDWLNGLLTASPLLADTGPARLMRDRRWRLTLPSELEWEKAARGGLADTLFPWGDAPDPNAANYHDSQVEHPSAVGAFPANGFGLHDTVGNVWEWTRSLWGADWQRPDFVYPYEADEAKREALDAGDGVFRVVRGGSWRYSLVFGRCAVRDWDQPESRLDGLGLRVVLRCCPVS